ATRSGAILTPRSVAAVTVSVVTSIVIQRIGYRLPWLAGIYLLGIGILLVGLGVGHFSVIGIGVSEFVVLAVLLGIAGAGIGLSAPPSQNASFDLMPDRIASAAGFRAMFANSGAVLGTTLVALALSQFSDKAQGLQYIFVALSVVVFLGQFWVY